MFRSPPTLLPFCSLPRFVLLAVTRTLASTGQRAIRVICSAAVSEPSAVPCCSCARTGQEVQGSISLVSSVCQPILHFSRARTC